MPVLVRGDGAGGGRGHPARRRSWPPAGRAAVARSGAGHQPAGADRPHAGAAALWLRRGARHHRRTDRPRQWYLEPGQHRRLPRRQRAAPAAGHQPARHARTLGAGAPGVEETPRLAFVSTAPARRRRWAARHRRARGGQHPRPGARPADRDHRQWRRLPRTAARPAGQAHRHGAHRAGDVAPPPGQEFCSG